VLFKKNWLTTCVTTTVGEQNLQGPVGGNVAFQDLAPVKQVIRPGGVRTLETNKRGSRRIGLALFVILIWSGKRDSKAFKGKVAFEYLA
jgi:hypothetical protein